MKFLLLLLIAMLGATVRLHATEQSPELVIYKGDTLMLDDNPLEGYFSKDHPRPRSFFEHEYLSSGCWRGY